MRLLILFVCCLAVVHCDQKAESTEVQTSNKLTSTKSSLNAIPSGPAQKTTILQQQPQQQTHQYVPQYVIQKPTAILASQHPSLHQYQQGDGGGQTAMFIIAQPTSSGGHGGHGGHSGHGSQSGTQSPLFQQAVQQLLSYYSNNPQARYQLLQQQGGPSSSGSGHGGHQVAVPQSGYGGGQVYHRAQMPTGALHVIPSPHLETQQQALSAAASAAISQTQHAQSIQPQHIQQSQPQAQPQHQQPQAIYAIPASSQSTLNAISPGLLAQLTGQNQGHQPQPQHVQYQPQYQTSQSLQSQLGSQLNNAQFFSHLPPQFGGQFPSGGPSQLPSQSQYSFGSQFPGFHLSQLGGQFSQQNQLNQQPQFFKQSTAPQGGNEYSLAQLAPQIAAQLAASQQSSQPDKNTQASSSNYTPIYRTAYIKG